MTSFSIKIEHRKMLSFVDNILTILNDWLVKEANKYFPDSNQTMIEFFGADAYSLPIYSSSRPETACITFKHTRKNHIIWIEYFKCDYSLKITFDDSSEDPDLVSLVKNYLDENNSLLTYKIGI